MRLALFLLLGAQAPETPTPAAPTAAAAEPVHHEESVTVSAAVTRSDTRLQDQPQRVEVIDREEIEEKALMTPGSVAMLLAETTGLRVQTTAPSLGAANVRVQGLPGRYTQLLADGLPLYGTQGDSLSLLQVPPLDLEQVEVIKGTATALHGAAALGGVINLVSRRPDATEREVLVNRTSLAGTDAATWLTRPSGGWSATLIGGYHDQVRQDVDEDGWTDVAGYRRGHLRPRVFRDDGRGSQVFVTAGTMREDRRGGTLPGGRAADGSSFDESLETLRLDVGALVRRLTGRGLVVTLRGSAMRVAHDRTFGEDGERGTRWAPFGELALQGARGRHTGAAGIAFQQDRYRARVHAVHDFTFTTLSAFGQDEVSFGRGLTLSLSARLDQHSRYGALLAPRVSILVRRTEGWTLRLSAGAGAFTPTPFVEETEEAGLGRLLPVHGLRPERAWGPALDMTRKIGRLEVTATAFLSEVRHPVRLREAGPETVALVNEDDPARTLGTEALVRYRAGGLFLLLTHGWTRSRGVPLTPEHTASMNAIFEGEEWGRVGVEAYYVGRQELDDDPYLTHGRPHVLLGLLGERRIGRVRLFVNAENLFDVRQTRHAPLVRRSPRADGRWTTDAWGPLDGRVVNGGIRVSF